MSGKIFYHDRVSKLAMLDNHSAFLEPDPLDSQLWIDKIRGYSKVAGSVLEIGTGLARVGEDVLRHKFSRIDAVEPSPNLL